MDDSEKKVNIAACPGMCNLAQLTQKSTQWVSEAGYGNLVKLHGLRAHQVKQVFSDAKDYSDEWVIIQGCENECGKKFLSRGDVEAGKSFIVAETGIERGIHVEYDDGVVQKVVDAIKVYLDQA